MKDPDVYILETVARTIVEGYSPKQGRIIFQAIIYTIDEINKDPGVDTSILAEKIKKRVKEQGFYD